MSPITAYRPVLCRADKRKPTAFLIHWTFRRKKVFADAASGQSLPVIVKIGSSYLHAMDLRHNERVLSARSVAND